MRSVYCVTGSVVEVNAAGLKASPQLMFAWMGGMEDSRVTRTLRCDWHKKYRNKNSWTSIIVSSILHHWSELWEGQYRERPGLGDHCRAHTHTQTDTRRYSIVQNGSFRDARLLLRKPQYREQTSNLRVLRSGVRVKSPNLDVWGSNTIHSAGTSPTAAAGIYAKPNRNLFFLNLLKQPIFHYRAGQITIRCISVLGPRTVATYQNLTSPAVDQWQSLPNSWVTLITPGSKRKGQLGWITGAREDWRENPCCNATKPFLGQLALCYRCCFFPFTSWLPPLPTCFFWFAVSQGFNKTCHYGQSPVTSPLPA